MSNRHQELPKIEPLPAVKFRRIPVKQKVATSDESPFGKTKIR